MDSESSKITYRVVLIKKLEDFPKSGSEKVNLSEVY